MRKSNGGKPPLAQAPLSPGWAGGCVHAATGVRGQVLQVLILSALGAPFFSRVLGAQSLHSPLGSARALLMRVRRADQAASWVLCSGCIFSEHVALGRGPLRSF